MATYAELRGIFGDDPYRKKVQAALVDQATIVLLEDDGTANHANRLAFAFLVMKDPERPAEAMSRAVLLKNKSATLNQLTTATDAAVLTEVAALYNEFAHSYNA